MLHGLVDHLWQSTWIFAAIALLAFVTRNNFAELRLWLWRIAAFKFVVPFSWLFAFGGWLGFPVPHAEFQAPQALTRTIAALTPLASPARAHEWNNLTLLLSFAGLAGCAIACVRWLRIRLDVERQRVAQEKARLELDADDFVARPGFFSSVLLTVCAVGFVGGPVLAGAVDDRQRRHELLLVNSMALRNAPVDMMPAAPGMGSRFRVLADEHGVVIRNVTLQELAGLAYGVTRYFVRGDHFASSQDDDWLTVPRYDVKVTGAVREPSDFDAYALRPLITRMLAEHHGLEIYVNNKCQPPCGRYGVPMPADPL